MLEVLNPLYFLSALGLLIPVALHFWNRKPPEVVAVGSIRWFKGSSTQSARSIYFKNLPLLLVRCLLLLVFTALLAGLIWNEELSESKSIDRLYLIQPELAAEFSQQETDSLQREGWLLRLIGPGLPPLADSLQLKGQSIDLWGAMREADVLADIRDTIRIYSQLKQAYFSGERPQLYRHFQFEEPENYQESRTTVHQAIKKKDTVWLQQALISADGIRLSWDSLPKSDFNFSRKSLSESAAELKDPESLKVLIVADEENERDGQVIQYALEAAYEGDPAIKLDITTDREKALSADVLIWLTDEELPVPEANRKQIVVHYTGEPRGEDWFEFVGSEGQRKFYQLNERPLPEQLSREKLSRLPTAFVDILCNSASDSLSGLLPMPIEQAKPLRAAAERQDPSTGTERENLHLWLWLLLVVLFSIERIWVYKS